MLKKRDKTALKDLAVVAAAGALALAASVYFDAFESFEVWPQRYEGWRLDERGDEFAILVLASGAYAWRRARELKLCRPAPDNIGETRKTARRVGV